MDPDHDRPRGGGARRGWESNSTMGERQALYANLEGLRGDHLRVPADLRPRMVPDPGIRPGPGRRRGRAQARQPQRDVFGRADRASADAAAAGRSDLRGHRRRGGGQPAAAPARGLVKKQLYHLATAVNGSVPCGCCRSTRGSSSYAARPAVHVLGVHLPRSRADPAVVAVDTATSDLVLIELTSTPMSFSTGGCGTPRSRPTTAWTCSRSWPATSPTSSRGVSSGPVRTSTSTPTRTRCRRLRRRSGGGAAVRPWSSQNLT